MAGLADSQLDLLQGEFIRCQTRPRTAWARHGLWVGALFTALACIGFALSDLAGIEAVAARALSASGVALLLAGLGCIAVNSLTAFSAMHLDLSYGTTGLYVGLLDEQHPWCTGPWAYCDTRLPKAIDRPSSASAARFAASTM